VVHFTINGAAIACICQESVALIKLYHERDCAIRPLQVVTLFVVASSNAVASYVYLVDAEVPITSPPRISYPNVAPFTDIARFRYEDTLFTCQASKSATLAESGYWPMLCSSKVHPYDNKSSANSLENITQFTLAQL
jgi:hypothetical protein